MRLLKRGALTSAAAVLTTLLAVTVPAFADGVGILELDQVSGVTEGTVSVPFTGSGTPLSNRFHYTFTGNDHHIKSVADLPGSGVVQVSFADKNGDDDYSYDIAHERVSPAGIVHGSFTDTCGGGSCTRAISRPAGDFVFVLTGFRFNFTDSDHHLDSIGVFESGGNLTTWFNDENNDDDYTATVTYAWVPGSRFSFLGEVRQDRLHAVGSFRSAAVAGTKVIRGFFIDNVGGGDNHIRNLGVATDSSGIDVFYADENPADSADWRFQVPYAVLI